MAKSIRLGRDRKHRLFVDLLLERPRPALKTEGAVIGLDSNYKNGMVLSDGQTVGTDLYPRIQTFARRQKHTHEEVKSMLGHAIRRINFAGTKTLCVENLKYVRHFKRGTFPRTLNRRLSHWLYAYADDLLARRCEEAGVRLERKSPAHTSTFCRVCRTWDRRNRRGDRFKCVHCGHSDHADLNAARNLELLGLADVYGLRSLPNLGNCLPSQSPR